jgi:hypothetical protein
MGFGLVSGFTGLLQNVTTGNYSAISNSHALQFTIAHAKSFQSTVSGNGFQWQMFPLLWVPELPPCLSYQLLAAMAHKD